MIEVSNYLPIGKVLEFSYMMEKKLYEDQYLQRQEGKTQGNFHSYLIYYTTVIFILIIEITEFAILF